MMAESVQYQSDLNSLLVISQIDNPSPTGLASGEFNNVSALASARLLISCFTLFAATGK